jgi:predicted transporter
MLLIFPDSNPYRNYALPMIIIGVALLITGYFVSHGLNGKQKLKKTATISSFGYVFGLFFLLVGLYVYLYYYTKWIGWIGLAFYPYRNYAIPMVLIGVALLITGYFTKRQAKRK